MSAVARWLSLMLGLWTSLTGLVPTLAAGTALLFDGTNDVVTVAGFGNSAPTNEITVEFWQRVNRVKAQSAFILNPDQTVNRFQAHTPFSDGRVYWDLGNFTNGGRLNYLPPVSLTNGWHHLAVVVSRSGGFMRIYRNGVLEASSNTNTSFTRGSFSLLIGGSAAFRFGGQLDEFRVWNTVRSQAQIQSNLNRTLTGAESNLVAYWRFDEGAGTAVGDSSGNGRNGIVARSNAWVLSTAPIGSPNVTTLAALNVSANSAILTGTVFTANQTTAAWFEHGTDTGYGSVTTTNSIPGTTNTVGVSRVLNGLTANTTYHLRLVATNGGGSAAGTNFTFTTPAARPAVTTLSANGITPSSARLRATANPNGLASFAWFEYGLTTNYGSISGTTNLGAGVNTITFSNVVSGLMPGRTYNFRVVATNIVGTSFSTNRTFLTPASAPSVVTLGTDTVAATTARLTGSVNPNGASTRFFFQFGLTTNYGNASAATNLAVGNLMLSLTGAVASLLPGNLYHYRAVATNVAGTNFGTNLTFSTPPLRPVVTTLAATSPATNGATLNASVDPNGAATDVVFEYGATTNYGSRTPVQNVARGNSTMSVSNVVSGLASGALFYFRAVATNSAGPSFGVDMTFTTASPAGPPIMSCAFQSGGAFLLGFNGEKGGTYSVLVSTNLTNWNLAGVATESSPGDFQFLDTNASGSRSRFYRLRMP